MRAARPFYFIRHGETDWNSVYKRLQGHTDIELNSRGLEQAQQLPQLTQPLGITKVFSSDLKRALRTAEFLGKPLSIDPRLREIHLGDAEGKTWDELEKIHSPEFRKLWSMNSEKNYDLRFEGGESRRQVTERILEVVTSTLHQHPEDRIAFVSHGFAIRSLVYHLTDLEGPYFVPNCAIVPFLIQDSKIIFKGPEDPEKLLRPILI